MALKHTYRLAIANDAGTGVVDSYVYTADAEENISDVATVGTVKHVNLAVTVLNIVSFFIESDQNVTVKTNASLYPDQHFDLTAGKALYWHTGLQGGNPLTTDITALYFDNTAGLKDANFKVGFLLNQGV